MKSILIIIVAISQYVLVLAQNPTVGTLTNTEDALNGYTLYSSFSSEFTYLIDNCGHKVNTWETSTEAGMAQEILEDGSLLKMRRKYNYQETPDGISSILEKLDWDGNVLWSFEYFNDVGGPGMANYKYLHHDFEVLPNGNILLLTWEGIHKSNFSDLGFQPSDIASWYDPTYKLMDKIIEIQPSGDSAIVVWKWDPLDHMIQNFDSTMSNYGNPNENSQKIDMHYGHDYYKRPWFHMNSIDYNADLDQILVSVRNMNEVWIIDHSTTTTEAATGVGGNSNLGGDLLYRWGNPNAYDQGNASEQVFFMIF